MKIGYAGLNTTIGCSSSKTFRLSSYNEKRLLETVEENLNCLYKILEFNLRNQLLFFRITSHLIPFASHPINTYPWQKKFQNEFKKLGKIIREHNFRISLHPNHFVQINSPNEELFHTSVREIQYHDDILNLLSLNKSAKIQIHVGGVYRNKTESIKRFIERYKLLSDQIKGRLVIENDQRLYTLSDCLSIYNEIGIPIVLDTFHHHLHNNGETPLAAVISASKTWKSEDGIPMIDYSTQKPGGRFGAHATHIDKKNFETFLRETSNIDKDVMLELKDKEQSALEAKKILDKIIA